MKKDEKVVLKMFITLFDKRMAKSHFTPQIEEQKCVDVMRPYFSSSTTFVSNPLSVNEVCCQWKLNESYLESMLGKFESEMHSS